MRKYVLVAALAISAAVVFVRGPSEDPSTPADPATVEGVVEIRDSGGEAVEAAVNPRSRTIDEEGMYKHFEDEALVYEGPMHPDKIQGPPLPVWQEWSHEALGLAISQWEREFTERPVDKSELATPSDQINAADWHELRLIDGRFLTGVRVTASEPLTEAQEQYVATYRDTKDLIAHFGNRAQYGFYVIEEDSIRKAYNAFHDLMTHPNLEALNGIADFAKEQLEAQGIGIGFSTLPVSRFTLHSLGGN